MSMNYRNRLLNLPLMMQYEISVVKCIISHQTISTSAILSPSFHPPVDLLILMNQVGSKLTGLILNYPMPSPPEDWTVTPLLGCMHKRIESLFSI